MTFAGVTGLTPTAAILWVVRVTLCRAAHLALRPERAKLGRDETVRIAVPLQTIDTARGVCFLLVFSMYLCLAQMKQVYLFLAFDLFTFQLNSQGVLVYPQRSITKTQSQFYRFQVV